MTSKVERFAWRLVRRGPNMAIFGAQWIVAFLFHPIRALDFWLTQRKFAEFRYDFACDIVTIRGLELSMSMVKNLNRYPVGTILSLTKTETGWRWTIKENMTAVS